VSDNQVNLGHIAQLVKVICLALLYFFFFTPLLDKFGVNVLLPVLVPKCNLCLVSVGESELYLMVTSLLFNVRS
jgi:hypothetical protein